MTLSAYALVTLNQVKSYLKIDPAYADRIEAEYVGLGDGETKAFTLDNTPLDGTLKVYVNGTLTTAYTSSGATITFTTAPTLNHPVTAAYDKAASGTFTGYEDANLELLINAATKKAEDYCGRYFMPRSITETRVGDNKKILRLSRQPVISVTTVTIDGTEVTDYEERLLSVGRLYREDTWPEDYEVVITYVAGYGDDAEATLEEVQALIPDAVMGILTAVAIWYENRLGASSQSITGIGSISYAEMGELPAPALKWLNSLKVGGIL